MQNYRNIHQPTKIDFFFFLKLILLSLMGLKALPCLFAYKIWIDSDFHNTRRSLPRWPLACYNTTSNRTFSCLHRLPRSRLSKSRSHVPLRPPTPVRGQICPSSAVRSSTHHCSDYPTCNTAFLSTFFWPVYKNDAEVLKLQESSLNLAMADFTHVSCQQWFLRIVHFRGEARMYYYMFVE